MRTGSAGTQPARAAWVRAQPPTTVSLLLVLLLCLSVGNFLVTFLCFFWQGGAKQATRSPPCHSTGTLGLVRPKRFSAGPCQRLANAFRQGGRRVGQDKPGQACPFPAAQSPQQCCQQQKRCRCSKAKENTPLNVLFLQAEHPRGMLCLSTTTCSSFSGDALSFDAM